MGGKIRWLIQKDIPQILEIEKHCFDYPWSEETIKEYLRKRNSIGIVFEENKKILGYLIYELEEKSISILKIAVRHDKRMRGIGKLLIERVIKKLAVPPNKRQEATIDVKESNLNAQLFLQKLNFMAVAIIDNCFQDVDAENDEYVEEDGYVFLYKIGHEILKLSLKNRISKYLDLSDKDTI